LKTALNKIYQHRLYPVLLLGIHLAILGTVIYFIDFCNDDQIQKILGKWIPWNLKFNFFLILTAIVVCHRDIFNAAKEFFNKRGAFLLVLVCSAFLISAFVASRTHRIYYDEDIYANTAQNIALNGQTGYSDYGTFEYDEYYSHWTTYNKEPSGWPYLISLVFDLGGIDELYAFVLNNVIFSASVLLTFLIAWNIGADYVTAFFAGLAFATIPHNLIWANTAAAEPSAAFFTGLTLLVLIVFLKTQKDRHLFALTVIIPFASQMRPESLLIGLLAFTAFCVFCPKMLTHRRVWTYALFITVMIAPSLLHIYFVSGHSWGAEGPKFSFDFLPNNLDCNGMYYLNNKEFPLILTVLATLGLVRTRFLLKWRLMILCWFILFWGIFLFFYAGSYRYGADVRFALLSFMPLAVLAGFGAGFMRDLITAINPATQKPDSHQPQTAVTLIILTVLFSFAGFLPMVRQVSQEAWGARYDHKFAREFIEKIPRRSIVLTHTPTMFLLWGQNAIQTYAGLNDPDLIENLIQKFQGHVYFHYNYWCNTQSLKNQRLCRAIKDKYHLKEIAFAREQHYEYGLYQMGLKEPRK